MTAVYQIDPPRRRGLTEFLPILIAGVVGCASALISDFVQKGNASALLVMNDVHKRNGRRVMALLASIFVASSMAACTPTVKIEAPDEPIEINLNIKIEQEVRIRLDKEVEDLIGDNPDIF